MPISKVIHYLSLFSLLHPLVSCEPVVPQQTSVKKKMVYDNYDYEDIVGNVNFFPGKTLRPDPLDNPIIILGQREDLSLEFDLLKEEVHYLGVKIYHCTKDWKASRLQDLEFLSEVNNFRITRSDMSLNTVKKYVNYQFDLPAPTLSGNYIVSVFRRSDPSDIIFNRRFFVVKDVCTIEALCKRSTTVSKRDDYQQLEIAVDYGKTRVDRPLEDLSITVMQNHNWNTLKTNIAPTLLRPNENYVAYEPVDLSLNFPGFSEFRFFDLSTLQVTGRNIYGIQIDREGETITANVRPVESRYKRPYTLDYRDINGKHLTRNTDVGRSYLASDYAHVKMQLKTPEINGKVYVIGRFNNWTIDDNSLLHYNATNGQYETTLLLKQGYYEYMYWVDSPAEPVYRIEGANFETENDYEVFVYYRQPGTIHDQIIGYKTFSSIPSR